MANQYYINRNGKIFGPYTKEAIRTAARKDKITFDDLISKSPRGPWITISLAKDHASSARLPAIKRSTAGDDPKKVETEASEWVQDDLFGDFPDLPVLPNKGKSASEKREGEKRSAKRRKRNKSRRGMVDYDNISLATPWQRLLAQTVDVLCGLLAVAPGVVLCVIGFLKIAPGEPASNELIIGVILACVGMLLIAVANLYYLFNDAQTIGKRYCNLQIFDVNTMRPAGFVRNFILRQVVNHTITVCLRRGTVYGGLYALINILFIFRSDHRCLHDWIAGTQVMDIS